MVQYGMNSGRKEGYPEQDNKIPIIKKKNTEYEEAVHLGFNRTNIPDMFCAFLLALTPILQHYKGLFIDSGVTALCIAAAWFTIRFLVSSKRIMINKKIVAPVAALCLFNLYKTLIHGVTLMNFIYGIVCIVLLIEVSAGMINLRCFYRAAEYISLLASVLIIVQYISYYIFGHHICMAPVSLLLPESSQWILVAQTGTAGINGKIGTLYRPSAFFLEPSHLYLYLFPHLLMLLFAKGVNKGRINKAILLSIAMLFSTSGMGVLVVFAAWCCYIVITKRKSDWITLASILKPGRIIIILCALVLVIGIASFVPFIGETISRFLDPSNSGAIAGRTRLANRLLTSLSGAQLLIGVTSTLEGIEFNMSGFSATLYKFGIIGVLLSYGVYIAGFLKTKGHYFMIAAVVLITSFFSAHTHGTFYMFYYVFILIDGLALPKKTE